MHERVADSTMAALRQRLAEGKPVRRTIEPLGRLHIDRPLPFLCIYRQPIDRPDAGTRRLVMGQGSFLIAAGEEDRQEAVGELLRSIVETVADKLGAMLLVEVWTAPRPAPVAFQRAAFRLLLPKQNMPAASVAALVRALRRIPLPGGRPKVRLVRGGRPAPPNLPLLITTGQARRGGCFILGIEVPPFYQDPQSQAAFPATLRQFRRHFSHALQQAFFSFMQMQTRLRAPHYQALGPRLITRTVLEADEQLADIAETFPFLLAVTPVNADAAYAQFEASGYVRPPVFHYRLLTADPELLKRRLFNVALEHIEDPALAELFREQRIDLDRQITMLEDRDTPRFLYGSLQIHGPVEEPLRHAAEQLLVDCASAHRGEMDEPATIDAVAFARRARQELDHYRRTMPDLDALVEIREDVPGIMVSQGRLLINRDLEFSPVRAEALLQHEVGTHLLTYFNGGAQPLRQLRCGLPGYEEMQEGLAVLSEYLVGGLTPPRLRLLAARVVAVHRMTAGRTFMEVFRELHERHGFPPRLAFTITMRVFRAGGFCKDAVYLRGLMRLLEHLSGGVELQTLLVGKISFESLPVIQELRWRGILKDPPLLPRYLETEQSQHRLHRLRRGIGLRELVH